jgi:hypothetical protein
MWTLAMVAVTCWGVRTVAVIMGSLAAGAESGTWAMPPMHQRMPPPVRCAASYRHRQSKLTTISVELDCHHGSPSA